MIPESTSKQERDDHEKRKQLQVKLLEAIRRSAPASEIRKIEAQIAEVNQRLESYEVRVKKVAISSGE